MCKEDALGALEQGADSIWISNGGHIKPDYLPSTISVLENISSAVRARYPEVEIYIDANI